MGQVDCDDLLDTAGSWGHYEHPVAQENRLWNRVGDEQDCRARLPTIAQQVLVELITRDRIQRSEWFVHK